MGWWPHDIWVALRHAIPDTLSLGDALHGTNSKARRTFRCWKLFLLAVHNYSTRYATDRNLYRPPSRSNYGLARFRVAVIPIEVKCLPFNTFKKEYRRLLLDSHWIHFRAVARKNLWLRQCPWKTYDRGNLSMVEFFLGIKSVYNDYKQQKWKKLPR